MSDSIFNDEDDNLVCPICDKKFLFEEDTIANYAKKASEQTDHIIDCLDSNVIVDDAFIPYRRMKMSHLWSPNLELLRGMVREIGVALKWIQDKRPYFIHYDVCKSKRELAIEAGAVPVPLRGMVRLNRLYRGRKMKEGNK